MMSHWERLLSAAPATTSWPPGFEAATVPPVSPGRIFKKSRVVATSSSAGRLQTVPKKKRRPSVLGGGFSTAGLSSPASSSCPWSDNSPIASSGCWQEIVGGLKKPGRRRGSCAESLRDDDDDDDEHADDKATTSEISVVGWGDRRRRHSSRRSSREDLGEWQDGRLRRLSSQGVVLAAATTAVYNSRQQQQQQQQQQATQEEPDGSMGNEGPGNSPAAEVNGATDAAAAAFVDIFSREATTSAVSEVGSTSISVENAPEIFTTCLIAAPPPCPETKQIGATASDSVNTVGPATASHLDKATLAPTSLNSLDEHKSGTHSRFPDVRPQQEQRRRRERGMDAEFLSHAGGLAAAMTTGPVAAGQKVFHNFVFRRNRRRSKNANGVEDSSSSSSSSLVEERNSAVNESSCALASQDNNATDRSLSAAGDREGRRRAGWSGGGSVGRSINARSSWSWRQRSWESLPSVEWDRRPPGQTKRTCSPPRTANDAFSVLSLGPAKPSKPSGAEGDGDGGVGGGGCCLGGQAKSPVKCKRCGSGRVRLFATAVASARFSPGYLQPLLPAAGQGREVSRSRATSTASGGRSDGYRRSDTGGGGAGGGSTDRLSSPPSVRGNQQASRSVAPTPVSFSSDHNKISRWSDNGRPGIKPRSLGEGGGGGGGGDRSVSVSASVSGSGSGSGKWQWHRRRREGGIVVDLRGRPDAAHTRRIKAASPRPPIRR